MSESEFEMAECEVKPLQQNDIYPVEKIVGMKIKKGKRLYKVRWKGYPPQKDTFEPEENLLFCKDMIQNLEAKLARKRPKKIVKKKIDDETLKLPHTDEKDPNIATCSINQRDTFWRDFNEGKICMPDQDMYSNVKARSARQGDGRHFSSHSKDVHRICPKVILKRRVNPKNSGSPTYKSTLQIKQSSLQTKKRKKYDVLRDYRRRRHRKRQGNMDENEHQQQGDNTAPNSILFSTSVIQRNFPNLAKISAKYESQMVEVPSNVECGKVLKELSANDEICSVEFPEYKPSPSVPNNTLKVLLQSPEKSYGSPLKSGDDISSVTKDISKLDVVKNHDTSENGKNNQTLQKKLSVKTENPSITSTAMHQTTCLNVVNTHQVEKWKSLPLNHGIVEEVLRNNISFKPCYTNRHIFDLFMAAAIQKKLDIIDKLCSRGISANQIQSDGTTVIMVASQMGLHEAVLVLLKHFAHKDRQNCHGETALMLACRYRRPEVVQLLLKDGANFALTNKKGRTALNISRTYASHTYIPDILNEHISRMLVEFEEKATDLLSDIVEVKHALFPIQCFSLSEGPKFCISFQHHTKLEPPGKGENLLYIANCSMRVRDVQCTFCSDLYVTNVVVNGKKLKSFRGGYSVFKLLFLENGENKVYITTTHNPQSEIKLVICAYRILYHRSQTYF